jgi:hypothetical protein
MLPVAAGQTPKITLSVDSTEATTLHAELRICSRPDGHTPDTALATLAVSVQAGKGQVIELDFRAAVDRPRYAFVCLVANPAIALHTSNLRVTGLLSLFHRYDQKPREDIGVEQFEFWTPVRRPAGKNLAIRVSDGLDAFTPASVKNGIARPVAQPNAWVADPSDSRPTLKLDWPEAQSIGLVELSFDTDFDHPMESALMGHPERDMPFCVKAYRILDDTGNEIARREENHQARNVIKLDPPVRTKRLSIEVTETHGAPASIFEVRCYH